MNVEKISFIKFVYPFSFSSKHFNQHVSALNEAKWEGREKPLTIWRLDRYPEEDLLPHVAQYLNPTDRDFAMAQLWMIDRNTLKSLRGLGGFEKKIKWDLLLPKGVISFKISDIQLSLFRIGVGFLTTEVSLFSEKQEHWLDLLHYFRFIRGGRSHPIKLQKERNQEEIIAHSEYQPFFPEPAGGLSKHPDGTGSFGEITDALLETGSISSQSKKWWRDIFIRNQLIPFACIFISEVPEREDPYLIYRIRNFFHSTQDIYPTQDELSLKQSSVLGYSNRQWFLFSLDGGAFVSTHSPDTPFFKQTLPDHLRNQYFLLFLLTLHQRFSLNLLSDEVAKQWVSIEEQANYDQRRRLFEEIRDSLLSFTARGHFTQTMQRENHHRCYSKWQQIFQIDKLYKEVSDEVREMHQHLLMKMAEEQQKQLKLQAEEEAHRDYLAQAQAQRFERRISLLGILIGIPALILAFLDVNIVGITTKSEGLPLWLALAICVVGGGLISGSVWFFLSKELKKMLKLIKSRDKK